MKVVLLSDTHGHFDPTWQTHFQGCDEIWHAGDLGSLEVADQLSRYAPLLAVYGNIDGPEVRAHYPEHQRFHRMGIDFWMTHIQPKRIKDCQIVIYGHSHQVKAQRDRSGVFHLNPGACGRQGFHQQKTLIKLQLQEGKVSALELVDLGPR